MSEAVRTITELPTPALGNFKVWKNGTALDGDDSTTPLQAPHFSDKCVQVTGTFDSTTVTLQGSNDPDADFDTGTWATLHDTAGNVLTFTAAGIKQILENPLKIRALNSGGGGSAALYVWFGIHTGARR